jgi:DNA-directed RNA polymerase specialized sigma24 family protein
LVHEVLPSGFLPRHVAAPQLRRGESKQKDVRCLDIREDDPLDEAQAKRSPDAGLPMSEPRALVEHFFRHEFGRLVAVLTGSLGVRRLALVEDVVQAALVQALESWSRRGVPEDPAGWLYRTARNLAINALRRERTHAQAAPTENSCVAASPSAGPMEASPPLSNARPKGKRRRGSRPL